MSNNVTKCYDCNKLIRASLLGDNVKRLCIACKTYRQNPPKISFIGDPFIEESNSNNINVEVQQISADQSEDGKVTLESTMKALGDLYIPKLNKRTLDDIIVPNQMNLEWDNPIAIQRANELLFRIYQPTAVNKSAGGFAIWENVPGWERIEIKDKPLVHFDPGPHLDIMFATAKIHVPADKVSGIKHISQTATYNELTHEVTAGCHFIGASIVTLALIKMYAEGHYTKERAQAEYGRAIMRVATELKEFEALMKTDNRFYKDVGQHLKETSIWERYVTGTVHHI